MPTRDPSPAPDSPRFAHLAADDLDDPCLAVKHAALHCNRTAPPKLSQRGTKAAGAAGAAHSTVWDGAAHAASTGAGRAGRKARESVRDSTAAQRQAQEEEHTAPASRLFDGLFGPTKFTGPELTRLRGGGVVQMARAAAAAATRPRGTSLSALRPRRR